MLLFTEFNSVERKINMSTTIERDHYFEACYDEETYAAEVKASVKSLLEHAYDYLKGKYGLRNYGMALTDIDYAHALAHSVKFHTALVQKLTDKQKKNVNFYYANFISIFDGPVGRHALDMFEHGKQDEAVEAIILLKTNVDRFYSMYREEFKF